MAVSHPSSFKRSNSTNDNLSIGAYLLIVFLVCSIKLLFLTVPKTSKSKFKSSIAVCLAIHPLIPVNKTLSDIFISYEKDAFQLQVPPCIPFQLQLQPV